MMQMQVTERYNNLRKKLNELSYTENFGIE
jgi:hypothetical protein